MGNISYFCFYLLNVSVPISLHVLNSSLCEPESEILYGKIQSTSIKTGGKGSRHKKYLVGEYLIQRNGTTYTETQRLGPKDSYVFPYLMVTIKKGCLGWEWCKSKVPTDSID